MLKLAGFNSTIYSFNKKTGVSFTPTAPTWNGDQMPNGDLILSEMGTKWGPSTTEMGTK